LDGIRQIDLSFAHKRAGKARDVLLGGRGDAVS